MSAAKIIRTFHMVKGEDDITVNILEDARIQIITDEISATNHKKADELLAFFKKLLGGECEIVKRRQSHMHAHAGIKHSH